ncbi:MAG TPA: phosphotransferase, partial [Rhizomicrobium sp.]
MTDRQHFLETSGWGGAEIMPLPGDASTRTYARVRKDGRQAMLMHQPQGAETSVAPADADEAARRALGYNAVARLAGADCRRFAAASEFLQAHGLSAPAIHAADFPHGWVLLEDLGDALYADVLAQGGDAEALYKAAVEVLARLHRASAPQELAPGLPLFAYDDVALIAETDLILEWFLPLALGRKASEGEYREHRSLWRDALGAVAGSAPVFVHRDYHAQNLLWLPERLGLARVGLIDFQDAVAGSRAYDLISLTEDARRDVQPELGEIATVHYLAAMRAQGTPLDE